MRSRIIETLQSKLVFLWHIPYRAIGIFWCECGGVLGVCQQIARDCIAEYDEAVTLGREVHRVAHRLFAIGTRCRADLVAWVGTSQPLKHFVHAYSILLEYALCPFVERCIEAVHAIIKRVGKSAPYSNPPYIVARVKEEQTMKLVETNSDFRGLVVKSWAAPRLLHDVLVLRYTADELHRMDRRTRINSNYQCSPEAQHEDLAVRHTRRDLHLRLALAPHVDAVCPEPWKQVILY